MNQPRVSWLLATRNRASMLEQALRCFRTQTYANRELVIIDGSDDPQPVAGENVHYIHVAPETSIGVCLNIGAEASTGDILQKVDDDDHYAPSFIAAAVDALQREERDATIVAWDCFYVLVPHDERLRFAGHGWSADGTLTFSRALWERTRFRDVRWAEESFRGDSGARVVNICAPESYILVRHDANNWTNLKGSDVNAYFGELPQGRTAADVIDRESLAFYRQWLWR